MVTEIITVHIECSKASETELQCKTGGSTVNMHYFKINGSSITFVDESGEFDDGLKGTYLREGMIIWNNPIITAWTKEGIYRLKKLIMFKSNLSKMFSLVSNRIF